MIYTVYILECSDFSLYTGYTNNLIKRIKDHNESKQGARYTKARRPVRVVHAERFKSLSRALKREAEIKKLTRTKKLELIKN